MKKKKLTDEELMTLAANEFIQLVKQFRDGDENAFDKAVYSPMLKKKGYNLGISRDFIHRIMTGEFDNADGIEVSMAKKGN